MQTPLEIHCGSCEGSVKSPWADRYFFVARVLLDCFSVCIPVARFIVIHVAADRCCRVTVSDVLFMLFVHPIPPFSFNVST